ncbi:MAG TPA: ATP-binding protein, partial [Actinoplanes sp.]|nr:ATP-binding protein [Actinoplanes sp.]
MENVSIGTEAGFVGRTQQIAALSRAWQEVRQGMTRVVGVEGEAGIGKTALVRRFLAQARPDTVIWVSGDEAEVTLPWGLGHQLAAELRGAGPAAPDAGPAAPDAGPAGPGAVPAGPDAVPAGSDRPETVLSAAAALANGLRGIGLAVVVVDDAHWADQMSMTALRVAVRRLAADPVLIVLIYQPPGAPGDVMAGNPSPGLDDGWRRVFESERGGHLTVTGLPAIDLIRLAVACGRPGLTPAGAARLYEHTGGHPMHVRHLLDELPMQAITSGNGALPAPRGVVTAVRPRLQRCDQGTRDLVAAGAVLGRRFRLATARALLDAADLSGPVTQALRVGLLEEVPGSAGQQLAFTSSLVNGLVYHDI